LCSHNYSSSLEKLQKYTQVRVAKSTNPLNFIYTKSAIPLQEEIMKKCLEKPVHGLRFGSVLPFHHPNGAFTTIPNERWQAV